VTPDLALALGDRVALLGKHERAVEAGKDLGPESADIRGLSFVGEARDVVLANKKLVGATLKQGRTLLDEESRRGVYVAKLVRAGNVIELRPRTTLQSGDVLTLYGPADSIEAVAHQAGYLVEDSEHVDYVYMGLGLIAGVLIGMVEIPLPGAPVHLGTGGGCLLSGLVFGWLRSKRPTFGSLPNAAALHLRDLGLAIFVANVGLAVGPQAVTLLQEKGFLLPVLSVVTVLVPLITSMYYAKYVLKLNPVMICGALAGCLTCTAGLNAIVAAADSETPVLGYTVPYAVANVLLTLLGPVIVLTV